MRTISTFICSLLLVSPLLAANLHAQNSNDFPGDGTSIAQVPHLVPFSGYLLDESGKPATSPTEITFALYKEQQGGPQLWIEIQKVNPDAQGHYTVLLGSVSPHGVPQGAFSTTEARWIGATPNGGVEAPRVMLFSVPYALKAADAETLGGLPASAFLPAQAPAVNPAATQAPCPLQLSPQVQPICPSNPFTPRGQGTQNHLTLWTGPETLGDSVAFQSGNNLGVGKTVLEGDGISAVNAKAFGAKGDGITDDTAAIAAAIAAIPATGGQLFFPPGKYITTGGFVLNAPTDVEGTGQASGDGTQWGSMIVDTSPTSTLFTVTAKVGIFRNIAMQNNASSTPTAGAAVLTTNSTDPTQRINFDQISVSGFYDDLDVFVGLSWSLRSSHIQNPVRYGLYIQNLVEPDDGDWSVSENYFEGGPRTSLTSSAAINIESSGGGKISENKINATYTNGIRMNVCCALSQTKIDLNDIENVTGPPINIVQGWAYVTIIGNYMLASSSNPCIFANGLDGFVISDNLLESNSTSPVPYAIVIKGASEYGLIGPNVVNHNFASATSVSCVQDCGDQSGLGAGTKAVYRCATSGTLPEGALTTNPANCGSSADTGLRVN